MNGFTTTLTLALGLELGPEKKCFLMGKDY